MPWNRSFDEARSRHPTGTVARALGLEPHAVEEALSWARARTDELISTLDDGELLSLLDPPGTSSAHAVPSVDRAEGEAEAGDEPMMSAAEASHRPTVRLAKVAAKEDEPAVSLGEAAKKDERPTVSLAKVGAEARENERPTVSLAKVGAEASEEPKTRRATLELPALEPGSDGEDLYGLQELDAIDLPPLEWGGTSTTSASASDERSESESELAFIEPEFIESDPDPADVAETVARVRPKRKRVKDRRTLTRYSLVEPAVIEVGSWSNLVTLYTKDISCGGMFVQTTNPPERDAEVAVQLLLPGEAGTLDFDGVVVHVVSPELAEATGRAAGFGLQFRGLTSERRRALQRIIDRAKAADDPGAEPPKLHDLGLSPSPGGRGLRLTLDATERRHLRELQAELVAMGNRDDLEVLGLSSYADAAELRQAFDRLARRWHPSVAHRDSPPELRKLATEIFLRIEQAYQRLSTAPRPVPQPVPPAEPQLPPPPAFSTDGPRPETVIGPAPTAPPGYERKPDPRVKQVRRTLGGLVERTETLTRKLEQRPAEPSPAGSGRSPESPAATRGVDRAAPASGPPRVGSAHSGRPGPRARRGSPAPRPRPGASSTAPELKGGVSARGRPRRFTPDPSASSRKSSNPVKEALGLIGAKRYAEAIEHLERVLKGRPQPRLRVLLGVVRARQAIQDRDFAAARAHYQKVLELDPNNALAERELLMLSAVGR